MLYVIWFDLMTVRLVDKIEWDGLVKSRLSDLANLSPFLFQQIEWINYRANYYITSFGKVHQGQKWSTFFLSTKHT